MKVVLQNFELVGSRAYSKDTKKVDLSETEVNALSALVQACQLAKDESKTSLYKGRAFCNMNAGKDSGSTPSGIMTLHDATLPVAPEMIADNLFQYLVVIPLIHPTNVGAQEYDDAYFQTEESKKRLNEAVPQYGESPYSITTHRSRRNNRDIRVWESELGQDDAWAGIFKGMHENGQDSDYYVVVRAGAPVACAKLRETISKLADASKPMTWEKFIHCDETSAARANAQTNARRIAFNVGLAFKAGVCNIQDGESHGKTQATMAISHNMTCQRICSVDDISVSDSKNVPTGECIAVFNEVVPSHRIQNDFYVIGSGADIMLQFDMISFRPTDVGVPCTTGRDVPLPDTVKEANERVSADEKLKAYHTKASKRFIWEDMESLTYHPDVSPDSHHSALPKRDHTFIDSLCELGGSRRNAHNIFYPVCVKLCNPYKKRPQETKVATTNNMEQFD